MTPHESDHPTVKTRAFKCVPREIIVTRQPCCVHVAGRMAGGTCRTIVDRRSLIDDTTSLIPFYVLQFHALTFTHAFMGKTGQNDTTSFYVLIDFAIYLK